jgi:ABC-type glutathione transport system ATPase component
VERLTDLRSVQAKVQDGPGVKIPAGPLALAFENVSFSYQDGASHQGNGTVLKNVVFGLEAGRILGLLGRTGSGKTTLARLVFRLYDPTGDIPRKAYPREAKTIDPARGFFHRCLFQAARDSLTFDRISDERSGRLQSDWPIACRFGDG